VTFMHTIKAGTRLAGSHEGSDKALALSSILNRTILRIHSSSGQSKRLLTARLGDSGPLDPLEC
jgi:hypothetical protein